MHTQINPRAVIMTDSFDLQVFLCVLVLRGGKVYKVIALKSAAACKWEHIGEQWPPTFSALSRKLLPTLSLCRSPHFHFHFFLHFHGNCSSHCHCVAPHTFTFFLPFHGNCSPHCHCVAPHTSTFTFFLHFHGNFSPHCVAVHLQNIFYLHLLSEKRQRWKFRN